MYLLRFLRYLERENYDITVIVRSFKRGELEWDYQSLGVKIIKQPLGYFQPGRMWNYYRLFRREQYDVICDFNANFAGLPMWLGRLAGIKRRMAFFRQGKDHFKASFLKNAFNKIMNRLVFRHATHILSNSQAAMDYFFPFRSTHDLRFKVIRNGVTISDYQLQETKEELRQQLDLPKEAFIIGHVGRLDPAKNHATILKVFQRVKQTQPNAHLVLCGRGTSQLQPQLKELGIESDTTLWEYRQDIPKVLKSLDCFLFPSLTEGQPNALIEAMVVGIPIVASNIPPVKECLPKEVWQQLSGPLDAEAMVNKIMNIYRQQSNTVGLKKWAMAQFDAEENFKKFKEVLVNG